MTPTRSRIEALVMRVQREFLDKPGLHLTLAQAEQRFGLDPFTCEGVLDALVDAGVLAKMPGGVYVRFIPTRPRLQPDTRHAA